MFTFTLHATQGLARAGSLILPHGTRDDIRREVRERFETLGRGGGLILCTAHNIQPDTPIDNVLALFEAYRELAVYSA